MEYITYNEYLKYSSILQIAEQETEYGISEPQENKRYNQEELKEINKKHDKMFRNILGIKKEMVNFLNQFLNIKEKIKEEQFIQCSTDFITKHYQDKHSDIIYKLKNKPVYFLVEHQSTIDKEMLERIGEYVGEIMRKRGGKSYESINQNVT